MALPLAKPPGAAPAASSGGAAAAMAPAPGAASGEAPIAEAVEEAPAKSVIATIISNGDGSYSLVEGGELPPEPEMIEGAEPIEQPTFSEVGALLKAVMELVQGAEGEDGGNDAEFAAGFGEEEGAAPAETEE